MSITARRPFGVSLLSILIMVSGVGNIISGIVMLFNDDDEDLLTAINVDSGDITAYAIITILWGVFAFFVGWTLWKGSSFSRYLVGILAAVQLVLVIWAAIAYHNIHWYNAMWPALIYAAIAGYLFYDKDAKAYFESRV